LRTTDYKKGKVILVSYLGTDKSLPESAVITNRLLDHVQKLIKKTHKDCIGILFDIEHPRSRPRQGKSRRRHFARYAIDRYRQLYEIPINYIRPKMALDIEEFAEGKLDLMYLPFNRRFTEPPRLLRASVLNILEIIYSHWYGSSFCYDPKLDKQYKEYVSSILDQYTASLPAEIELKLVVR
jgi:hypothetical protein